MKRLLTAAALIPFIAWVVLGANHWIFLAVLATVAVLCYREYDGIVAGYGFGAPGPLGYGAGLLVLVWNGDPWLLFVAAAMLALALAMRSERLSDALPRTAFLIAGTVYIFGTWRCALPLRAANPNWLMFALLVSWTGDAGAYYVGRKFGRHKMAPRVSPNKSWEGAAASVAVSILLAGGYLVRFVPGVAVWQAVALTIVANVAGQVGDLVESAIKRGAAVKDSGDLLPGHGGMLDRVDSSLFAVPVVYAWLRLVA